MRQNAWESEAGMKSQAEEPVSFCVPDITGEEIEAVMAVLKSGWITGGPVTAAFEEALCRFCGTEYAVTFSSATAALELVLRAFGVGPGDEVITTPYTYTATAGAIHHTGARPVLADCLPGSYHIDPERTGALINEKTKAVIPVDFAGWPADYGKLSDLLESKRSCFRPAGTEQERLGRVMLLGDCAHSLGAQVNGKDVACLPDVAVFSFHAVKNLTTAEGGAALFREQAGIFDSGFRRRLKLLALHGQSKDAREKFLGGGWEYDVELIGYKCNMTDLQAALGVSQLGRYPAQLARRREIYALYDRELDPAVGRPPFEGAGITGSCHIYPVQVPPEARNRIIASAAEEGVSLNVHFKPLPLMTCWREQFKDAVWDQAAWMWQGEISLPVYPALSDRAVCRVAAAVNRALRSGGSSVHENREV